MQDACGKDTVTHTGTTQTREKQESQPIVRRLKLLASFEFYRYGTSCQSTTHRGPSATNHCEGAETVIAIAAASVGSAGNGGSGGSSGGVSADGAAAANSAAPGTAKLDAFVGAAAAAVGAAASAGAAVELRRLLTPLFLPVSFALHHAQSGTGN